MARPTVYHIPICPFSQRIEIVLALKGVEDQVAFEVVDVTKPRPEWLLAKTRGSTTMPILEVAEGKVIKESLVILRYMDLLHRPAIARSDPWQRAVEDMLISHEGAFISAGYRFVMNQDRARRSSLEANMLARWAELSEFLDHHNPGGVYLFEDFGLAEAVFTPMFVRFWFLEYYEHFELPGEPRFARARAWRDACLAHPMAQQVSREAVVKLYYDYAMGVGNGALGDGRVCSTFAFEPDWSERPWPPRDKYGAVASDGELGLL